MSDIWFFRIGMAVIFVAFLFLSGVSFRYRAMLRKHPGKSVLYKMILSRYRRRVFVIMCVMAAGFLTAFASAWLDLD